MEHVIPTLGRGEDSKAGTNNFLYATEVKVADHFCLHRRVTNLPLPVVKGVGKLVLLLSSHVQEKGEDGCKGYY